MLFLLPLLLMALLSNTKALIQGKYSKQIIHTTTDSLAYNTFIFIFAACAILLVFFEPRFPSALTLLLAVLFGLASMLFQMSYLLAMRHGTVSLTLLITKFALVPTSLFGIVAYQEQLTVQKLIGMALVLISIVPLVLKNDTDKSKEPLAGKSSFPWVLLAISAMIFASIGQLLQKIHQKSPYSAEKGMFVGYAYLSAFLFSVLMIFCMMLYHKKRELTFRPGKGVVLSTLVAGVLLGFYQLLSLWCAQNMDSALMYPVVSFFEIFVGFVFGILFFGERFSKQRWVGSLMGVAGVLLLSL